MQIPIGHKFILGFVVVVAAVAFTPNAVQLLGYAPELSNILTYVVAMTVGLILGWLFSRSFSGNIAQLTQSAEAISQGDLTRDVELPPARFPDETNELAESINRMVESLRDLVHQVHAASGRVSESASTLSSTALQVNASTEEVAQAIEQISRGAESQAERVEQSSKIIHEMAVSIEIVAKRARESARDARETSHTAKRGGEAVRSSLEGIKGLFDNVEQSSRQFASFNARLQQVGKIADVIGNIARQTNLLALNAAIEAARAGEMGRGFAVVADEVRKLADGTAHSASEIVDLIDLIKEESRSVHETMGRSVGLLNDGKRTLDATASSLDEIISTVIETERKATSIADLSQMQTEGAEKMVQEIDEIAKVAEDNAASTEQVSAATEQQSAAMHEMAIAAQELASLAEELVAFVERFQIADQGEQQT